MKTINETTRLRYFEFWDGADDLAGKLTNSEFDQIEVELEQLYPEGITETGLNDLFWFEGEYICELIGLNVDEIYNR
jgi:hypothetical protein